MRVLFIDPPGIGQPRDKQRGMNLNLAIAALSQILIQHQHIVSLLDMENHNENRTMMAVEKALNDFNPDIIGISIINAQYRHAMELLKKLGKITDIPIVAGGAEVTASGEKIFRDSDFVLSISVLGEGEESFLRIVENLENNNGSELENIRGLIINNNGKLQRTGPPQVIENIDKYPFPDFDLFGIRKIKLYKILGSRGCPYNCSFCFNYLGTTWRSRSPENIIRNWLQQKRNTVLTDLDLRIPTSIVNRSGLIRFATPLRNQTCTEYLGAQL